jgi:hypothetical protein
MRVSVMRPSEEGVRRPTPPAWQVTSDFKTGKAIQSSPRDLKYHFFSCLAANNHEKGSVVTTHELSSLRTCRIEMVTFIATDTSGKSGYN